MEYGMSRPGETRAVIRSFEDLDVWQQGHALVIVIYDLTKGYPKEEVYGLVSQMRRSAVSITSNIAEGFGRFSIKEKAQFYLIAKGSLVELHNQLLISRDVGYISPEITATTIEQLTRVHKILNGLITKTKTTF